MNVSYWEHKTWFKSVDFTIVGGGIVGLNCALKLREKYPKSKIVILEKGTLPSGASTKNAGFACFGSLSEILNDLETHTEEEVFNLVNKRINGLKVLRKNLGDKSIDYKQCGGYELFFENDKHTFETCLSKKDEINTLLSPLFNAKAFEVVTDKFGFKSTRKSQLFTPFEGMLDTGKMMWALYKKAVEKNIMVLNGLKLSHYSEHLENVSLFVNETFEFRTSKLFIATNGFANQLLSEEIQPARAQVLITKPIKNLKIEGTFHLDKGYYYFRNIDNRILFGGGRNLDFKTEETTDFGITQTVQNKLETLLNEVILPETPYEIERRWSGIMGVGNQKKPILKQLSNNVFCGIRLGGMGVAIGSMVGQDMANFI